MRILRGQLRHHQRQFVREGEICGGDEDVLGDGQDELIDRQHDGQLPTSGDRAGRRQARTQSRLLLVGQRRLRRRPVRGSSGLQVACGIRSRGVEVVLQSAHPAKACANAPDQFFAVFVAPPITTPDTVALANLAADAGSARLAKDVSSMIRPRRGSGTCFEAVRGRE